MIFKLRSRHALCAVTYLALDGRGRVVTAQEIADRRSISLPYLTRILGTLARRGVIASHHGGVEKGYSLDRDPRSITLYEILDAFEGWSEGGALFDPFDDPCHCPAFCHLEELRDRMFQPLREKTLADMCTHQSSGDASKKTAEAAAH